MRDGRGFDAHELLEDLWRAAPRPERDLYQGLVHVAVATYQESRGNEVGRTRQLEKAVRRLTPRLNRHGCEAGLPLHLDRRSLKGREQPERTDGQHERQGIV